MLTVKVYLSICLYTHVAMNQVGSGSSVCVLYNGYFITVFFSKVHRERKICNHCQCALHQIFLQVTRSRKFLCYGCRVLKMMGTVVDHSSENRMTASAVAACMAPLLLRPLLAGECGLEDDSDVSGDNAAQLLAAAAAANSAQAIITMLLEDHDKIFEVKLY